MSPICEPERTTVDQAVPLAQGVAMRRAIAFLVVAVALLPPTASALDVVGGTIHSSAGNDGLDAFLGAASSQTCFLAGVSGSLVGNPTLSGKGLLPASAEVLERDGFWFLRTRTGVGTGVKAHAICIGHKPICVNGKCVVPKLNRVEFPWQDNITSQGVPATPNRHCFLRRVWATSGLSGDKRNGQQTNLTISKHGGEFVMNGSYVENKGGDRDFGGARAVCVDIVPTAKWEFTHIGPPNSTKTITLRNSYPNGAPVPVANIGCFLTGIAGRWINPDPNPLNDGAFLAGPVFLPPKSTNWQLTASNGRQATVSCLK